MFSKSHRLHVDIFRWCFFFYWYEGILSSSSKTMHSFHEVLMNFDRFIHNYLRRLWSQTMCVAIRNYTIPITSLLRSPISRPKIDSIGCSDIIRHERLRLVKIYGCESSSGHHSKAPRSLRCRFSTPPPAPTLKFNCELAMAADTHVHVFGTTIVLELDSIALTVGAPIPNTFLPYEVATSPTTLNMWVVQNDWRI